jgi:hypothetical protein
MTLHILKLCVGCGSVEELASWQRRRLATLRNSDPQGELMHVTRQTPRREGFVPGAASLYWVIGGFIRARQKITALREVQGADGIARCGLVLDPEIVMTEPSPRRAFQGWRYLDAADVPADLPAGAAEAHEAMPPAMRQALTELRLI